MKVENLQGSWEGIHAWWTDWAKGKLFRVSKKGNDVSDFCFIDQIVNLGNDVMLGLSTYNGCYDDLREPGSLTFSLLSQVRLAWYQDDINDENSCGGWSDEDFERVWCAYESVGISNPEDINNVPLS